jgi:hypothetical protein
VVKGWFSAFVDHLESMIISLKTKKLSSTAIADHITQVQNFPICSETIRLKCKELLDNIQPPKPQKKCSGVVVHDEQFVTIKGVELKRISTVDANNPNVYYDELHANRTEETMIEVCKKLHRKIEELYAVVVDGHPASKKRLGMEKGRVLCRWSISLVFSV